MSNKHNHKTDPIKAKVYQIRIKGQLDHKWKEWFGDVTISPEDNGDTLITCPVPDQAALHGLLRKVRDLGMTLLSVNRVKTDQEESLDADR